MEIKRTIEYGRWNIDALVDSEGSMRYQISWMDLNGRRKAGEKFFRTIIDAQKFVDKHLS